MASSSAQFPVFLIRLFSSPQFPHCLMKGLQFPPLRHQRAKDPRFSITPSRAPNFLFRSLKWWYQISHHVIKGSQFIIALSRGPSPPIATSNFPSRYQWVPRQDKARWWPFTHIHFDNITQQNSSCSHCTVRDRTVTMWWLSSHLLET